MKIFEFRVVVEDTFDAPACSGIETTPGILTRVLIDHPAVLGACPLVQAGAGDHLVADMQNVRQSGLTRVEINTALRLGEVS